MNHFDEYALKILKCSENTLVDILNETENRNTAILIKKRNSKNTVIYYIHLNPFSLTNIKTLLYRRNIPFFIKAVMSFHGSGVCWVLNNNYSLSNISASKVRYIDWFEQEERYKVFQLLRMTG